MEKSKKRRRGVTATQVLKLAAIVIFLFVAVASFVYTAASLFDAPSYVVSYGNTRLAEVKSLQFDQTEGKLTWSKVRNATCYIVEADGESFTADTNEWLCPASLQPTSLRVKAVDLTGRHGDSVWSYIETGVPD